jgi:hypothetical protein
MYKDLLSKVYNRDILLSYNNRASYKYILNTYNDFHDLNKY